VTLSDEDLGLDAEEHPTSGLWRWIWNNDAGAQRFGLFLFEDEKSCRTAGRKWIRDHIKKATDITNGDLPADD
jgi:hypothetical protein